MLNQVVLVGRIVKKPELKETENDKKYTHITLAVPRSYKNINGEYDTDFLDCVLWDSVATSTTEFCNKGDIVGVCGRIQNRIVENDGIKKSVLEIVAEKVMFLNHKQEKDLENVEKDIEI